MGILVLINAETRDKPTFLSYDFYVVQIITQYYICAYSDVYHKYTVYQCPLLVV